MTTRSHYWPALDGLRGVAVLSVLLYHFGAPLGSGGYLGVDVFFVISGCVVTATLRRAQARGATLTEFFSRRAARLLPNLAVLLLVTLVWDTYHDHRLLSSANAAVLEGLTQTSNLFGSSSLPTRHLWSLSLEWQFYALLPLVLPLICLRGLPAAPTWAAVIAITSIVLRPLLERTAGMSQAHVYLWPFTRLDGLMLGVAVALLVEQGRRLSRKALPIAATIVALGLVLFAPTWYTRADTSLFYVMPLGSVSAFLIVWSLVSSDATALLNRVLSWRWLRYAGERSYSIYLWHYFVGIALIAGEETWQGGATFAAQMILSVGIAIVAYDWIERPAREHFNRLIAVHVSTGRIAASPREVHGN